MKKCYLLFLIIASPFTCNVLGQSVSIEMFNVGLIYQDFPKMKAVLSIINKTQDTVYLPGILQGQASYPDELSYIRYNRLVKNCSLDTSAFRKSVRNVFSNSSCGSLIMLVSKTDCDSLIMDCSVDWDDDYTLEGKIFSKMNIKNEFDLSFEGMFLFQRALILKPADTAYLQIVLNFSDFNLTPGIYKMGLLYNMSNYINHPYVLQKIYSKFNFIKTPVFSNKLQLEVKERNDVKICPKADPFTSSE